jgi:parallel beta-helix repeat protein
MDYNGTVTINSGSSKVVRTGGSKHYYTFKNLTFVSNHVNYNGSFDYSLDFEDGSWNGQTDPNGGNNGYLIDNCKITGAVHFYGHYNTIQNSTLAGNGQWGNGVFEYFAQSHDNVYRNNIIHDYTQRGLWSMQLANHVLMEGNTIYNCGSIGNIDLDGAGNPVSYAKVRKNIIYNYGQEGILCESTMNSIIEDNIIYGWLGSGDGDGIQVINYGPSISPAEYRGTNTNNIFRNNLIEGSGRAGINLISSPGNKVYNNTIYNTKAPSGYYGAISLTNDGSSYYSNNSTIMNNVVFGWNSYAFWYSSSVSGLKATNNIYYDPSKTNTHYNQTTSKAYTLSGFQGIGYETNSSFTNPLFVNASATATSANFVLQSTSPALKAGVNLTPDVTDDINSNPRAATGNYAAGAYDTSNSTTTPTLPAPKNLAVQ